MMRNRHSSVAGPGEQTRAGRPNHPGRAAVFAAALLPMLAAAPAGSQATDASDSALKAPADSTVRGTEILPAVTQPFRTGEVLRFSVQYGPIHAGSAWLEVHGPHPGDATSVETLVARAESNSFFSLTYRVRNRIESSWDVRERRSLRYREDRHEGGFKAKSEIVFDQDLGEARYSDGRVFPIPPGVQDALSSFYYTRTQPLPIGGSVLFDYHASGRSQPLEVRVIGRDRVHVPAGTFDCVVVEPILHAGGIFKNNGRLQIWLTADARRMPVLMKSKVAIGSISVVLQDATPGGG